MPVPCGELVVSSVSVKPVNWSRLMFAKFAQREEAVAGVPDARDQPVRRRTEVAEIVAFDAARGHAEHQPHRGVG